jgi:hypothetical protein
VECPSGPDVLKGYGNEAGRDCSGRGLCNYDTGVCECFRGYHGKMCQYQVYLPVFIFFLVYIHFLLRRASTLLAKFAAITHSKLIICIYIIVFLILRIGALINKYPRTYLL